MFSCEKEANRACEIRSRSFHLTSAISEKLLRAFENDTLKGHLGLFFKMNILIRAMAHKWFVFKSSKGLLKSGGYYIVGIIIVLESLVNVCYST